MDGIDLLRGDVAGSLCKLVLMLRAELKSSHSAGPGLIRGKLPQVSRVNKRGCYAFVGTPF